MSTILTIDDPQFPLHNHRSGLERRQTDAAAPAHVDRRRGSDRRGRAGKSAEPTTSEPIPGGGRKPWFAIWQPRRASESADVPASVSGGARNQGTDTGGQKERAGERTDYNAPLLLEDVEIHKSYDAVMRNFSRHGMGLEIEHAPRVGSATVIHIPNYSPRAAAPENLRKYYARVVWVQKLSGMVVFNRYAVGIKFCADVDEFFRLFGQ